MNDYKDTCFGNRRNYRSGYRGCNSLVERLRYLAQVAKVPVMKNALTEAADRIEELEARERWISVDERLPEKGDVYFVLRGTRGNPDIATGLSGEWCMVGKPVQLHDVTHWKPITPPERK